MQNASVQIKRETGNQIDRKNLSGLLSSCKHMNRHFRPDWSSAAEHFFLATARALSQLLFLTLIKMFK